MRTFRSGAGYSGSGHSCRGKGWSALPTNRSPCISTSGRRPGRPEALSWARTRPAVTEDLNPRQPRPSRSPRRSLHLSALGESERILDVDAKISNGAFDLGMSEQNLHSAQVSNLLVDDRRLGARRMRAVVLRPRVYSSDPFIDVAGILPGADMTRLIDPAWEDGGVNRTAPTLKPGQQTDRNARNVRNLQIRILAGCRKTSASWFPYSRAIRHCLLCWFFLDFPIYVRGGQACAETLGFRHPDRQPSQFNAGRVWQISARFDERRSHFVRLTVESGRFVRSGPMGGQRHEGALGPQDLGHDRLPERRRADLLIEDVVDGHGFRGDGSIRSDQARPALVVQTREAVVTLLDTPASRSHRRRGGRCRRFPGGRRECGGGVRTPALRLFQLAVFAAAPIDRRVDDAGIAPGLAGDACDDAGQGVPPLLGNVLAALDALQAGGASGKSSQGVLHAVRDRVLDLVQDRAFVRPACRHFVASYSRSS